MTRKTSHFQRSEPFLEKILSLNRFKKAEKYIPENSVVADLGCGYNGNFLRLISPKIKSGVGFDISVTKINPAKNIILKKADLNRFPVYRKDYFNIITALAVLEHVESPDELIKKANTMLKAGGKLIISTPHKKSKRLLEFLAFKLGAISKSEIRDHKNYFDKRHLKKLLERNGFRLIHIGGFEGNLNLLAVAQKIT